MEVVRRPGEDTNRPGPCSKTVLRDAEEKEETPKGTLGTLMGQSASLKGRIHESRRKLSPKE